jgi:hypothetical protein
MRSGCGPRLSWDDVPLQVPTGCHQWRFPVPLGLDFHAGSLIAPLSAATPHGTCESAMNAAVFRTHVASERGGELRGVEEEKRRTERQNSNGG